jgi:hypothetical protein
VSTHDTDRIFEELRNLSLSKSSRRLSRESGLRQVGIEQPKSKNHVQLLSFKPVILLQEFRIATGFAVLRVKKCVDWTTRLLKTKHFST